MFENIDDTTDRIKELERRLVEVHKSLAPINAAISNLDQQVKDDAALAADADFADRRTAEVGRKAILERSQKEIEAELTRLRGESL